MSNALLPSYQLTFVEKFSTYKGMTVAIVFKELFKQAGRGSQVAFANYMGWDRSTVTKLINGGRGFDVEEVKKAAVFFRVRPEIFLNHDEGYEIPTVNAFGDRKGWECVKCKTIYSPDIKECGKCKPKSKRS